MYVFQHWSTPVTLLYTATEVHCSLKWISVVSALSVLTIYGVGLGIVIFKDMFRFIPI